MTLRAASIIGAYRKSVARRVIRIEQGRNTSPQGREAHTWLAN